MFNKVINPLLSDTELAHQLASAAGDVLLSVRARYCEGSERERGQAGDERSHAWLRAELARTRPRDSVLSEEGADDSARLCEDRVWIVDPLDGTREFSELERDDWAVHVALWQRGNLVAGAVTLPARGITVSAPRVALATRATGRPRIVVSRTRPPAFGRRLQNRLGAELGAMGSAGAKVVSILEGAADIYVHAEGQYEWDSAAPVAVARAAGLHTSRMDGSPLIYNQRHPLLPDLVVCRREYAEAVLQAVSDEDAGGAELVSVP